MVVTILVILLAIIAGIVSYLQYKNGKNNYSIMWAFIVLYWVVLTVKNICDLLHI